MLTVCIHCITAANATSLEDKVWSVYLIAVLVVLEACVVVHKAVEFLKALVFFLSLQNSDETPATVNLLRMVFLLTEKAEIL